MSYRVYKTLDIENKENNGKFEKTAEKKTDIRAFATRAKNRKKHVSEPPPLHRKLIIHFVINKEVI